MGNKEKKEKPDTVKIYDGKGNVVGEALRYVTQNPRHIPVNQFVPHPINVDLKEEDRNQLNQNGIYDVLEEFKSRLRMSKVVGNVDSVHPITPPFQQDRQQQLDCEYTVDLKRIAVCYPHRFAGDDEETTSLKMKEFVESQIRAWGGECFLPEDIIDREISKALEKIDSEGVPRVVNTNNGYELKSWDDFKKDKSKPKAPEKDPVQKIQWAVDDDGFVLIGIFENAGEKCCDRCESGQFSKQKTHTFCPGVCKITKLHWGCDKFKEALPTVALSEGL